MRSTIFLIILAVAGLAGVLVAVARMWSQAGIHLSLHGWIAYGLGASASFALAAGLFFLTFKSDRDDDDDIADPEHSSHNSGE